jgi:hypothetical protein
MAKKKEAKTDSEKILAALEDVHTRLEDLFVLEACRAGIKHHEIRAILAIDIKRVTRIGRHVKQKEI